MKLSLLLFSLFINSAGFSSSMISSDLAELDGRDLFLDGHIKVTHPSFKLEANHAALFGYDDQKSPPFSIINLSDSAHMLFSNYHIECEEAAINLQTLKGVLKSTGKKVLISDEKDHSLTLAGYHVEFSFEPHQLNPHHFEIKNFRAKDQIEITHQNSLKLLCDEVELDRGLTLPLSTKLIARATNDACECECQYFQEVIKAKTIIYDPINHLISMEAAHGDLESLYQALSHEGKCQFVTDYLEWNQTSHLLEFHGYSKFTDPFLGSLECEKQLIIQQVPEYDHYVVETIQTQGPSKLTYRDETDLSFHYLFCPGEMLFDRHYLTVVAKAKEGSITQTYYENDEMILYADEISIEYTLKDFALKAHKVHLKGHLKCIAKNPDKEHFQYALADELLYFPLDNKTHLSAYLGSKVLFWNEKEFLKISADAVDIIQDAKGVKETIKSKGHVRLYFNPEEEKMLEDMFTTFLKTNQVDACSKFES